MFKKGDIVVRTNNTYRPETNFIETNNGFIFKCLRESNRAYYKNGSSCQENNVRKATEEEIKWFEAGITNINQIPEVGGTFNTLTIKHIVFGLSSPILTNKGSYSLKYWVENYLRVYKPPIKSTVDREVMFGKPFKPEDLKNCKIGNLTPEDHEIIQPFLFSLGYKWNSGNKVTYTNAYYLAVTNVIRYGGAEDYDESNKLEIKKELILNYIKQLNTNKNEVHRQNQEITRRPINGSARILSGRQQGSTGSRPKGNIQSIKGRETYFRRSEICGSVRLR